jgi:CelD/BcsL family acetyltransferase involved in cellulose biosynthesis
MRIDVVAPLDLSASDMAAWSALQAADPALASGYLGPHWPRACASVDGPDRQGARVLVVRDRERPVGFLPFRLSGRRARPVGAPMCDYQAMVTEPGVSLDPRELVRAAGAARLDFTHLLADQTPFAPFMRGRGLSQVIDISGGYEAYAAERRAGGHGILKDTAKKGRKLERDHGAAVFTALSASREDFETLIAWKRRQYRATRQTDIFDAGWPMELLRDLFERRDPAFRAALFTLHVKGSLIAAHLALNVPGVLHAWFIAHDNAFGAYSPGVVLIDHMLRWGAGNAVREVDLGPGDYRFKFQLANRTREVAHGFVAASPTSALVREAQYRVRTAVEALPLGRVSAWPGKAMRRMDLVTGLR